MANTPYSRRPNPNGSFDVVDADQRVVENHPTIGEADARVRSLNHVERRPIDVPTEWRELDG